MSDPFIYVQWLSAKSSLMEALENGDTWDDRCKIVDEWFKEHVFEVGVDYFASDRMLHEPPGVVEKHIISASAGQLVNEILNRGLYMQTSNPVKNYQQQFTTTVLVFGSTKKIIGPSTRKLS